MWGHGPRGQRPPGPRFGGPRFGLRGMGGNFRPGPPGMFGGPGIPFQRPPVRCQQPEVFQVTHAVTVHV